MGQVLQLKRCKLQRSHGFATGLKGRVAWPNDEARGMKEPPAASHLAREADPMTASTHWAVQCGCADYYGSVLPVPEQYTENAKERVPAHGCVALVERAACHPRSTDRGEKGELYRLDPDDRLKLLDTLIGKAKAIRHRNKLPSAPAE